MNDLRTICSSEMRGELLCPTVLFGLTYKVEGDILLLLGCIVTALLTLLTSFSYVYECCLISKIPLNV